MSGMGLSIARENLERGRIEGRESGILIGRAEGRAEGEKNLAALIRKLLADNRMSDIQKAAEDASCRQRLLKEYGLA